MRALAFDLPDFGETIAPAGFEHTVPGYAAFVDAALAALGVERVHLVLHDFGGPIGLAWAAANAERLDALTLIDIGILPRLQVAPAGADLAHAGARRGLPGDDDAPRLPRGWSAAPSRAASPAPSSNGCTTTTTGGPSGRC